LLPPVLVGLVLAGVFAATMSTADSLILSCSASITEDFTSGERAPVWIAKAATLLVTVFALALALQGNHTVFSLVIVSWAVLAAAFAPLMTVYVLGGRPSQATAIAMTLVGVATVFLWTRVDILSDYYEGALAILLGFATYAIGQRLGTTSARSRAASAADRNLGTHHG
jgi:sodium/proline symporter